MRVMTILWHWCDVRARRSERSDKLYSVASQIKQQNNFLYRITGMDILLPAYRFSTFVPTICSLPLFSSQESGGGHRLEDFPLLPHLQHGDWPPVPAGTNSPRSAGLKGAF